LINPSFQSCHGRGIAGCTLELKVIPNAPRDEIAGWLGGALKVKVHAPALDGRANAAVTLVRGERSNHKVVRIDGVSLDEARRRLEV
jgi:hypothetical protein